ncbi:MAG: hypothetical protein OXE75_05460 [bacterium]|nr:hypothetical protein [bacterium]
MTHAGYIAAGWSISAALLAGYAVMILLRGRRLSGKVPARRRRWMTAED